MHAFNNYMYNPRTSTLSQWVHGMCASECFPNGRVTLGILQSQLRPVWCQIIRIYQIILSYSTHVTRKQALKSLSMSYPKKDWRAGDFDLCHGKMCQDLCCCIPKEGLVGGARPILLLVWKHRLENIICKDSRVQLYSQCHTQRRIDGALPANPSLGMTKTKILRHIFQWQSSISCHFLQQSGITIKSCPL